MNSQASTVERVARAMCAADGHDPDQPQSSGRNWKDYEPEARRFMAAYNVVSQMEWPGKLT